MIQKGLWNEGTKVCVSNRFIEQQAYDFSEKIRVSSLYRFVGTELSKDDLVTSNGTVEDPFVLITKVILEDTDGTLYYVAPNVNGLRFAKREITYKEYKKLQKNETRNAIVMFFGILGFFSVFMITMMKYLT